MQLRDYLHFNKMLKKDFAKKIGYNAHFVGAVAEYVRKPSKRFAKVIEIATDGQVTVDEIMSAHYKNDKKEASSS